ncbi:MAG: glucose-6-phosphate dehydrogenase assembly protein OpcA [Candidatus Eisenbacteria bacterium]
MTAVDAHGREVLGGGGVLPVEVHALGAELRRLWETTGDPAGTDSTAVTRTCTRNVIVLCHDTDAARAAATLVAGVADRYPSRAFIVRLDGDGPPDRLEATLEAQCLVRAGGRQMCCEQIVLAVGAAAGRRAASAIVPLLVPDLPVFVWSMDALPDWDDELLVRLLDVADRVLVDSRGVPDPAALLADLALHERRDRWSPADFEWARLADWREAVAMLFEDPSLAARPPVVERVTVRHGRPGASAAALLAGWVLDRLEAAGERSAVAVSFEATAGEGGVEGLGIELAGGFRLEAERAPDGGTLRLGIAAPDACALPGRVPCDEASVERLLEDLLAAHAEEPIYERALARAATLLAGEFKA